MTPACVGLTKILTSTMTPPRGSGSQFKKLGRGSRTPRSPLMVLPDSQGVSASLETCTGLGYGAYLGSRDDCVCQVSESLASRKLAAKPVV